MWDHESVGLICLSKDYEEATALDATRSLSLTLDKRDERKKDVQFLDNCSEGA